MSSVKPSLVYLVKSQGYYKIGLTNNLPRRLKQFKTGNPDIELIHTWENLPIDARFWEKRLHKMLWEYRLVNRKEWFNFSHAMIESIKQLHP